MLKGIKLMDAGKITISDVSNLNKNLIIKLGYKELKLFLRVK